MEQRYNKETGLPVDRAYLECGLPPYLQRSLDTLLENLHRVALNPLEEAAAYQQMIDDFGIKI